MKFGQKSPESNSGCALFAVIIGVSAILMVILLLSLTDHFLFDGAGVATLRSANPKLFTGIILLLTLGSGPIIMILAMRYNRNYEEKMMVKFKEVDRIENEENGQWNSTADGEGDPIREKAEAYWAADPAFADIYQRYRYFLTQVAAEPAKRRNQMIEIHSVAQPTFLQAVYLPGILLLLILGQFIMTYFYFEGKYGITPGEAISVAWLKNPTTTKIIGGLMMVLVLWAVISYSIKSLLSVFQTIGAIEEKATNRQRAGSMTGQYRRFLSETWRQISPTNHQTAHHIFFALTIIPLSLGLILGEKFLFLLGSGFLLLTLLFRFLKQKNGPGFRFSEQGWIRLENRRAKKDISLKTCQELVVQYCPFQQSVSAYSSLSSISRDRFTKALMGNMQMASLVPDCILIETQSGAGYQLPLRQIVDPVGDPFESHELEFFLAFWLKENGFSLTLETTNEDAGNWRAQIQHQ